MGYGVNVRVWGDYACFTRPEMKVERVSYDFITPSAAKGILDCIYWKPAIRWVIDKIHVLKPIRFTNIRRNEVKSKMSLSKVKGIMKKANHVDEQQLFSISETSEKKEDVYSILITDDRTQRAAMVLRDVEYVIEAHFELIKENCGTEDTVEKHYNVALRRLRNGQFFQKPFLGTREFPCDFEIIENVDFIYRISDEFKGSKDYGYMLLNLDFQIDKKKDTMKVEPQFFKAVLVDGTLDLTNVSEVKK
ncbi:MAG: type I-C CRISPR-associated protein Cas5c [Candidatus Cloacimonetes bacterium]|nr:type I-C CRISPR-associated protein Cas5c [Candidatus Cloacimonadota bacterium]